jgi:hypothetical protein
VQKRAILKSVFTSRTLWFNALALAVLVSQAMGYTIPGVPAMDPTQIGLGLAVVNVVLRFFTTKPVGLVS